MEGHEFDHRCELGQVDYAGFHLRQAHADFFELAHAEECITRCVLVQDVEVRLDRRGEKKRQPFRCRFEDRRRVHTMIRFIDARKE